ncbi:ABC transporter ATP-binding protein/permease [Patescibacteria group bacterium]|nr:ABC transporter ATP-binding protein/permease [Patescibacteria group bacterium]
MKKHLAVGAVLKVFFRHLKPYPVATFLAIGLTALAIAIDIFIPLLYKRIIDTAAAAPMATEEVAALMIGMLVLTISVVIVRQAARRGGVIASIYVEPKVMSDMTQNAYSYLVGHSYRFFVNNFTGSLVRRVGRLTRAYEEWFDRLVYDFIPIGVSLTGITIVLFLRDPKLGLAFGVWVVIFLAIQIGVARWMLKYNLAVAERDSEVTGVLSDAISNDVTIKTFAGEDEERRLLGEAVTKQRKAFYKSWTLNEIVNSVQTVMMVLIEFVLFFTAIHLWAEGVLTVGDFVLIQAYLLVAIDRLWNFGSALRKLFEAFADATEMVEIMDEPHEVQDVKNAKALSVTGGAISFNNVDFGFNDSGNVLQDFNLSIGSHEKVALVGPSGAGKTTITKLILRFFDVKGGAIVIDGQNIAEVTQKSLRESIAFMPQEPTLFHRTLMENIRYGRLDATDDEVIEAARKAHCDEFITKAPEGFDTFVGERGIKLSGGERQRIAIARAILKDAPILVLDEATSSLDSESESLIQDALTKLMADKTVIAIAHRLSTVMKMDRIIVIENGKVVTTGTHQDLVKHEGGLYKKLWEIQAGGFLTDDLRKSS